MQFPRSAVQLLCSVQSEDAAAVVPLSSVQLVHVMSLKHAAQHAAVVLHANGGASMPSLLEQHVPLVNSCRILHDAKLPTPAAAPPVTSSVCTMSTDCIDRTVV